MHDSNFTLLSDASQRPKKPMPVPAVSSTHPIPRPVRKSCAPVSNTTKCPYPLHNKRLWLTWRTCCGGYSTSTPQTYRTDNDKKRYGKKDTPSEYSFAKTSFWQPGSGFPLAVWKDRGKRADCQAQDGTSSGRTIENIAPVSMRQLHLRDSRCMVLTEFLLTPAPTNCRMQNQAWKVHRTVWEEGSNIKKSCGKVDFWAIQGYWLAGWTNGLAWYNSPSCRDSRETAWKENYGRGAKGALTSFTWFTWFTAFRALLFSVFSYFVLFIILFSLPVLLRPGVEWVRFSQWGLFFVQ